MKVLVVDNFDSFTFNLVHYIEQFTEEPVTVLRNTELNPRDILDFDKIVLSPGPGLPSETKNLLEIAKMAIEHRPLLGVCLGHQAIYQALGGRLKQLPRVLHGCSTEIELQASCPIFKTLDKDVIVGHYHSWVVDEGAKPNSLEVKARDKNGHVMAFQHRTKPVFGVQFHPESVLTPDGLTIIKNWIVSC